MPDRVSPNLEHLRTDTGRSLYEPEEESALDFPSKDRGRQGFLSNVIPFSKEKSYYDT
jgi:hypothetical protein